MSGGLSWGTLWVFVKMFKDFEKICEEVSERVTYQRGIDDTSMLKNGECSGMFPLTIDVVSCIHFGAA